MPPGTVSWKAVFRAARSTRLKIAGTLQRLVGRAVLSRVARSMRQKLTNVLHRLTGRRAKLRVARALTCAACGLFYVLAGLFILILDVVPTIAELAGLDDASFGDSSYEVMPLLRALTVAGGLYMAYRLSRSKYCCMCHGDRPLQDI